MDRLSVLKKTLPYNLKSADSSVEFIVVDYNSSDGLAQWIEREMKAPIDEGILKFFQIVSPIPRYFSHAHSRNVAFRLASGKLLVNTNADYYVEPEFFGYMKGWFSGNSRRAAVYSYSDGPKDNFGRICLRKEDFIKVSGYDEQFKGYGYEDADLSARLITSGVLVYEVRESFWSRFETQTEESRGAKMYDFERINSIWVKKIDKQTSQIAFEYENEVVCYGTIQKTEHDIPCLLESDGWCVSKWQSSAGNRSESEGDCLAKDQFTQIMDDAALKKVLLTKSQIENYQRLKNNIRSVGIRVNPQGFGCAEVSKNFGAELIKL